MCGADRFNRCASASAALVASLALIGWFAGVPLLASGLPGEATMKIPTAAAFLVAALAMTLMPVRTPAARLVVRGCAVLIMLFGCASLLKLLGGFEPVFQAMAASAAAEAVSAGGQSVATNTALAFVCLGASILLLTGPTRSMQILAGGVAASIAAWVGFYEAIGYLGAVLTGHGWGALTSMSLPTALLLCLLGGACLFTAWRAAGATWTVRRGFTASFLAGLLALSGLAILSYDGLLDYSSAAEQLRRAHEMQAVLHRLDERLNSGEVAMRDHALTGQEQAATGMETTLRGASADMARLRASLRGQPDQLRRLERLEAYVREQARFGRAVVDARRSNGQPAALALMATGEGLLIKRRVEAELGAMVQAGQGVVDARSAQSHAAATAIAHQLPIATFAGMAALSILFLLFNAEVAQRQRAERTLRTREEQVRTDAATHAAILDAVPAQLALLDATGTVVAVNAAWRHFAVANRLSMPDFAIGTNYLAVAEQATGERGAEGRRAAAGIRRVLSSETAEFSLEYPCHAPDQQRWFRLVATPAVVAGSGGAVVMHLDITDRRVALARLERLNRLQTLLGHIGEAVLQSKGPEEVFASVCQTLAEEEPLQAAFIVEVREGARTGSHEAQVTCAAGKTADVLPRQAVVFEDLANGLGTIGAALRSGTYDVCNDIEAAPRAELFKELARRGQFRSSASFAFRRGRATSGALVVCARETDHFHADEISLMEAVARYLTLAVELHEQQQTRARAEAALQASEQRFRLLAEATNDAIWEYQVATDRLGWSEGFQRLFGYDRDRVEPGLASWMNRIHPEDHARVVSSFQAALDGAGSTWRDDYRFICADGSEAHVADRAHIIRGDEGQALTVFGGMTDHTERRRAQQALRRQAEMLDQVGQSVITVDLAGKVVYANRACEELFGWTREEMIGRLAVELLVAPSCLSKAEEVMSTLAQGRTWVGEIDLSARDGRTVTVHATDSPIIDDEGHAVGIIGVLADMTERKRAEQVLRESEGELRVLTEQLSAERERLLEAQAVAKLGSWETDLTTMNVSWSPENYRIYELSSDHSPTYESSRQLVHPGDWTRIDEAFRASLASALPGPFVAEHRLVFPDGRIKHVEERWRVVRNEAGQPLRVSGTCLDVTERHAAQQALLESERQFEILANAMPQFVWVADAQGRSVYVNDRWHAYTSASVEQLNEASVQVFHPDDAPRAARLWQHALETGTRYVAEARMRGLDSEYRWFLIRGEPQKDDDGQVLKWFGTSTDIQELKQAEVEISRSNRALQLLSRCNEALIRAQDEATLLTDVCRIAVETGGYRLAWVADVRLGETGAVDVKAHHGEATHLNRIARTPGGGQGNADLVLQIRSAAASGQPVLMSWRDPAELGEMPDAGGADGAPSVCCVPLRSSTGLLGVLVLHDSTDHPAPEAESKLLQELADNVGFGLANLRSRLERLRLQQAVEQVAGAVSTISGDAFFVELSRHMAAVLDAPAAFVARLLPGHPPRARTLAGCVNGRPAHGFDFQLEDYPGFAGGEEAALTRGMAEQYPVLGRLAGIHAQAFVGARLMNTSGEQVGLLFVLYNAPLHDTAFIASTLRIFAARAASEIERQQSHALLVEQATLLDAAHEAIYLKSLDGELRYWSKGAERLLGWKADEVVGCDLPEVFTDEAKLEQARRQVRLDGVWEGEFEARSKHGHLLILESSWTLISDEAGQPQSILVISTDVTERKQIEKQFFRAQRMESIGTLAGGIAHDLNNALAPVITGLDLLQMKFPDEETHELLELIGVSAQRGVEMVRQVLSFARGVEGAQIEVQVRPILQEMEKIIRDSFPKNIQLRASVDADLWTVQGDPTQIHQVLMNLCVNARDAMPDGGHLTLTAANREIGANDAGLMLDAAAGPYVMLQVSDTGTGMPPETIERIFEPFFTTKDVGQGTGLGLSTTLAIIKSHSGSIQVSSEVGRGTTFTVYLPARTLASADKTEDEAAELPRGQGQLVLVVDDEASVRQVTRQTLEAFGYRVVMASDGADALAIHADRHGEIDVVLTDMMMPQVDGPSMISALRRIDPALPVIAASGLTASAQLTQAASLGVEHFLPKPYSAETLLRTLKTVCDGSASQAGLEQPT